MLRPGVGFPLLVSLALPVAFAVAAVSAEPGSSPSGKVRGSFVIAGLKSSPSYVYAGRERGGLAGRAEIQLYFRTSPPKGWTESGALDGDAPWVSAWLTADGKLVEVCYVPAGEGRPLELMGPGHVFEKIELDDAHVRGRLRSEKTFKGFDGKEYGVDVSFNVPILAKTVSK